MTPTPRLIAIVPAAGVGARAATPPSGDGPVVPKQYRPIAAQPMLRRAVQALLADARVERVVVAVSAGDGWVEAALSGMPRVEWMECGGA